MKKSRIIVLISLLLVSIVVIFSNVKHPIVLASDDYPTSGYDVGFNDQTDIDPTTTLKVSSTKVNMRLIVKNKNSSVTKGNYKVKYKTLDGNMIASEGDYSAIDSTDTVTNVSYNSYNYIRFSLTVNKPTVTVGSGEYYFYIVAYNVNGQDITTESQTYAKIKIVVEPEYNFNVTQKDGYGDVINEYVAVNNSSMLSGGTIINGDKQDIKAGTETRYNFNIKKNISKLYDAGIADAFVGITGSFSAPTWSSYPNGWLTTKLYQDGYMYNIKSPSYTSKFITSNDVGWDNIFPCYDDSDFTYSSTYKLGKYYNYMIADDSTRIFRNGSKLAFFKIDNANTDVQFTIGNESSNNEWEVKEFRYFAFVADITAPQYKHAYILDSMKEATSTNKLRICVEFSEPVQLIDSSNSKISAKLNTNGLSNYLNLKYVAGEGTTRLVYELDEEGYPSTNFSTKIESISFENTQIRDYSYNGEYRDTNKQEFSKNFATLGTFSTNFNFLIDSRNEEVSLTKGINDNNPHQTNDVTIKILNVSEGFTFKYALVESDVTPIDDDYTEIPDFKLSGENYSTDSFYYTTLTLGYKLNGIYNFYYTVTSKYGITKNTNKDEALELKFDNTAPEVKEFSATRGDYQTYNYSFYLKEEPLFDKTILDKLEYIKFAYSASPLSANKEVNYIDIKGVTNNSISFNCENVTDDGQYKDYYKVTFTIIGTLVGVGVDSAKNYKDLYVGVVIKDISGNEYTLADNTDISVRYDSRSILPGEFEEIKGTKFDNINFDVYKITEDSKPQIIYNCTQSGDYTLSYTILKYENSNFVDITKSQSGIYFNYNVTDCTDNSTSYKKATVTFLIPGYYTVQFYVSDQYSETKSIFVATGTDKTNNKNSQLYSVNKVYSTNNNKFFYYGNDGITTEYYNNVQKNQIFSSEYLRNEYLKYYEYSDLCAIKINNDQATSLNSNASMTYKKAVGETKVAQVGQIWIRYKRSDWSFSTSSSDWVYYYYGDYTDESINVYYLSNNANLRNAIEAVVSTIAKNCGDPIYLVDDGSGDSITTFTSDQIHTTRETTSTTRTGKTITNAYFSGDDTLYDSVYVVEGEEYQLYSNATFKFNDYTHIYIKSLSNKNNDYVEISAKYSGYELKYILQQLYSKSAVDGTYEIVEIDENGLSYTKVYVVATPPNITIKYSTGSKDETETTITEKYNGESYRVSKLTLEGFANVSGYFDKYSYILIRNNSTLDYVVYYQSDFSTYKTFSDGSYSVIISDRFKNTYAINVTIDSTETNFELSKVDNEYVRFTSSVDPDAIFTFTVKLNGQVISSTYGQTLTFKDSGNYEFTLVDVNGNSVTKTIELTRDAPEVTWRMIDDGEYKEINNENEGTIIEKSNSTLYYIYTNKLLVFSFSGDYTFIFTGDPDYTSNLVLSQTRVEIKSETSFTVKISYREFSYNYITYVVIFDASLPEVSPTTNVSNVTLNDISKIIAGPTKADDLITDIGFTPDKESPTYDYNIANNGQVYAKNVNVSITDESKLKSIDIYFKGELILSKTDIKDTTFKTTLDFVDKDGNILEGTCKIVAKDILGNTSEYSFDNKQPDLYHEYLDSESATINTDLDKAYSETKYAHGSVTYKINNFELFVIQYNDVAYYITFNDNVVYLYTYKVISETETTYIYDKNNLATIDFNDEKIQSSTYQKFKLDLSNLEIYAKTDGSYLYIDIRNVSEEKVNFITRLTSNYTNNPFYSNVEMYNVKSSVDFTNESKDSIDFNDGISYINKNFCINENIDENIKTIIYRYSEDSNKTGESKTVDLTKLKDTWYGKDDGYYYFDVINKYGNITQYVINVFESLKVEIKMTYKDESTIDYSYKGDINYYSNHQANILVYDLNASIGVKKDSEDYKFELIKNDDYLSFVISESGTYRVTITDKYNNDRSFVLKISESDFEVNNDIFTGFNEDALRKEELYTNQKLSIDETKLEEYGIYYISYRYYNDSKENVLYYKLFEKKEEMTNIIGNDGNGVYYIVLRDAYGNTCVKQVHYQETSVFEIYKKIVTSDEYNKIEIEDDYVYSNDILEFRTEASVYKFTIDSNSYNLKYSLKFHEASLTGEYTYKITYVDEYGFKYSFNAVLLRRNIECNISSKTTDLNGVSTLNKDFSVIFDTDYSAYYLLDNKSYDYTSDSPLHLDGLYTFTIFDKAGNTKTLNILKDSIVSFTAYERDTSRTVVLGDVSNNGNVCIKATRDGEYLTVKKAYLNGVLKTDQESVFSDNGKWEMLICDEIGNEAYFSFYIYTHVLAKFSYNTPYNYIITRLDYTNLSGTKISYLSNVIQYDNYSSVVLSDNGSYDLVMTSKADRSIVSFSVLINDETPNVELVGVDNHGSTSDNVTIKGYQVGDVIRIYKDNSLIKTVNVTTSDMSSPVISELGDYRIEVTNTQGNTTVLEFKRQYTANSASSILIIVILVVIASALFAGLFLRKREKID